MKWRFVTDLLDWSCFASELQRNWSFCIWQPAARLSGATVNPGVVQRNASLLVRIGRLKGWVHSSVTNSVIIYSTSCQRRAREKFPQNISGASRAQVKQTPLDPNLVWKYHFYAQIFTFAAEFKARTGACWCSLKWCTKLICNVYKNKKNTNFRSHGFLFGCFLFVSAVYSHPSSSVLRHCSALKLQEGRDNTISEVYITKLMMAGFNLAALFSASRYLCAISQCQC